MQQLIRFSVVGLSNMVVSYLALRLAFIFLPAMVFQSFAAQILSYSSGIVWSYYWNRRYTFQATANTQSAFPKFVALQFMVMAMTAVSFDYLDNQMEGHTFPWLLVMGVATILNFLASRHWVFR